MVGDAHFSGTAQSAYPFKELTQAIFSSLTDDGTNCITPAVEPCPIASARDGGLRRETAVHEEDERPRVTLTPHLGCRRPCWFHADVLAFQHNIVLAGSHPCYRKAIA